ncbi:MAG: translation initiation factor IF-2 [Deltaproteobacteria bacterium]|nr:translation initiation factor IF-2 [Deltaproteobacteria bacterium]
MAKVRVYELAKELDMDSKELVKKLKAGGIEIKNYMSTLDEEAVARAREVVAGVVSEVVEEKRVRPTVIRRRKKTVTMEPEAPAPSAAAEAEEAPAVEKGAPPSEEPVKEEAPAREAPVERVEEEAAEPGEPPAAEHGAELGETVVEEAPLEAEGAKPMPREKAREKAKKGKKKKIDQPARIIKPPEEGPLRDLLKKEKEETVKVRTSEPSAPPVPGPVVVGPPEAEEPASKKKKEKRKAEKKEVAPKGAIRQRKIEVFERADLYEGRLVRRKKKEGISKEAQKKMKQTEITVPRAAKRRIKVPEKFTVAELAKAMGVKASDLIRRLMRQGVIANLNQGLDFESASLIAEEFGYELELDQVTFEDVLTEVKDKPEDLKFRPPVVTIMGHVDHGKTSLLDYIRNSNIIAGESGGITQHIGAYYVERENGDVVFLDTPGHEAFTAMRARGAKVTDIIVLVVAADDGVMPQTREAINHARAAGIPIIVAVNKIDKPEANPEKVRRELAELELVPEEWGGDTIFGYLSAKTGEGVDELLELILLQAEMLELKANPDKSARGTVVEARLDKSRGPVATVLIKSGTLKQGDHFVCGEHFGRVRAMLNSRGKRMVSAGPSLPLEIYGISGVPMAGDEFIVVQDERRAKQIIDYRQEKVKVREMTRRGIVSLDDLFEKIKEGEVKELNIVIKADVQGSLEALSDSLVKLSTEEVKLKIIHSSTGAISETDVMLASASGAIIIGFNVRANPRVSEIAEKEKVDIRYYDVIYNVIQDVKMAMAGLLEPIYRENVIGRVDIKETFHVPKVGTVAGCYVTDGKVERNAHVRLLREEVVIFDGKLASLRRFKDDVKEVMAGYECGIGLENFQDVKPGDVFEIYQIEEVAPEL